jgi:hypothetical protein
MKRGPRDHQKAGNGSCLYQCKLCGAKEQVPKDVLEYFDAVDPGLPGQPATFACQACPGIMYPSWWFERDSQ